MLNVRFDLTLMSRKIIVLSPIIHHSTTQATKMLTKVISSGHHSHASSFPQTDELAFWRVYGQLILRSLETNLIRPPLSSLRDTCIALSVLPHFAYMSIKAFPIRTFTFFVEKNNFMPMSISPIAHALSSSALWPHRVSLLLVSSHQTSPELYFETHTWHTQQFIPFQETTPLSSNHHFPRTRKILHLSVTKQPSREIRHPSHHVPGNKRRKLIISLRSKSSDSRSSITILECNFVASKGDCSRRKR